MYNPENLEILKILVQTIVRCNLTYSFSATYTLSRDREVARTKECPNKKFACGKTKQSPYLFLFVVAQIIAPLARLHAQPLKTLLQAMCEIYRVFPCQCKAYHGWQIEI